MINNCDFQKHAIIDASLCNEGVPKRNLVIGSLDWWGIDLIRIKLQLNLPEYTDGHSKTYWDCEEGSLNSGLVPEPPETVTYSEPKGN